MRRALAAGLALALVPALASSADELGREVFTQIAEPACAICHTLKAADAAGTIGPSLDELKPDKARVLEAVRKGLGAMPPFGDKLTAQQMDAVAAFIAKSAGRQ